MPHIVVIRFCEVGEAARANRHWTDEDTASRLLGDLTALERSERRCSQWVGGVALALMGGLLVCGLLSW